MGAQSNDILAAFEEARPELQLFKFLRNASSPAMNVNGSITPVKFEYVVPAGRELYAQRLNFEFINTGMKPDNFAGVAALTNGLLIEVLDDDNTPLIDFTDGLGIKNQTEFAPLAGVDANVTSGGGTPDGLAVRWTMARTGAPIYMTAGQKFVLTVRDDLSTITQMRAMLQGILLKRDQP